MKKQLRIVSIGAGNVACHLIPALQKAGHRITQVYSRKLSNAKSLAKLTNSHAINKTKQLSLDCDLIIVSIPDEHIESSVLDFGLDVYDGIVAHTSGSTASLKHVKHPGVIYPLQSFNKSRIVDFIEIPIFITSPDIRTKRILKSIAEQLSIRTHYITDEKRRELHLAAVVLNNFMHHLAYKSEEYLKLKNLKFEYLDELMKTGFDKILEKRLKQSQTGPAKRGDLKTIKEHKSLLKEDRSLLKLYNAFTNSILETYGHK